MATTVAAAPTTGPTLAEQTVNAVSILHCDDGTAESSHWIHSTGPRDDWTGGSSASDTDAATDWPPTVTDVAGDNEEDPLTLGQSLSFHAQSLVACMDWGCSDHWLRLLQSMSSRSLPCTRGDLGFFKPRCHWKYCFLDWRRTTCPTQGLSCTVASPWSTLLPPLRWCGLDCCHREHCEKGSDWLEPCTGTAPFSDGRFVRGELSMHSFFHQQRNLWHCPRSALLRLVHMYWQGWWWTDWRADSAKALWRLSLALTCSTLSTDCGWTIVWQLEVLNDAHWNLLNWKLGWSSSSKAWLLVHCLYWVRRWRALSCTDTTAEAFFGTSCSLCLKAKWLDWTLMTCPIGCSLRIVNAARVATVPLATDDDDDTDESTVDVILGSLPLGHRTTVQLQSFFSELKWYYSELTGPYHCLRTINCIE